MKKVFSLLIALLFIGIAYSQNVGDPFQGGIVAYILQPGDPGYIQGQIHGLIAAPNDQNTNIHWYNGSFTTTGATATALGTGKANTNTIVANQGAGNYAASLCANLVLGGYRDWYLPSKDELNKLYLNRAKIGGFIDDAYWSSTEINKSDAWLQIFPDSDQMNGNKLGPGPVRAVRSF